MELTQDEKNRIYNEEKVRLEAQERLKKEKKVSIGEIIQLSLTFIAIAWGIWFMYGICFGK